MISIKRPDTVPKTLQTRGSDDRGSMETEYTAHKDEYDAGTRKFEFDRDIYGAKDVKKALKEMQHDKCAFCEAKVTHISHGDVEHFRPKRAWKQDDGDPLQRPGYYWLGYEWTNLFLACQLCNQRHKRNLFPLVNPQARARNHLGEIEAEISIFIDPCTEDPAEHITFDKYDPTPVNGSERGHSTIQALGLSRVELREHRLAHFNKLRAIKDLLDTAFKLNPPPNLASRLDDIRQMLLKSIQPDAEYSAMARALFGNNL